ncbi:MAG: hypothetical protein U0768_17860 [Anaerolineae bacterium]
MFRKALIAVGLVVAVALALGVGVVAHAQGSAPNAAKGGAKTFWSALAQRLNTSEDALATAVRDAAKDTVAQRLASGAMTQAQADKLGARIQNWQPGQGLGFFGKGRPGMALAAHKIIVDAAAPVLKLQPADLTAQLKQGKSLNDIAKTQNVDPTAVSTAIGKALKDRVAQAQTNNRLTADQAQKADARIDQELPTIMSRTWTAKSGATPKTGGQGHQGRSANPAGLVAGRAGIEAAAKALNTTTQAVTQGIAGGQSIRAQAQAKGLNPADVQAAIVAAENNAIDQAAQQGKISADQASQFKSRVDTLVSGLMDRAGRTPNKVAPQAKPATPAPSGA